MALLGNKSLRVRINVSILIICVSLALLALITAVPYEKQRRENRLRDIAVMIDAVYKQKKEGLANELFAGQMVALQKSLQDLQALKHITRIELYHLDGQFCLSSDGGAAPSLPEPVRQRLLSGPDFSKQYLNRRPCAVYSALIEIIGEKIGYIRIQYDLGEMERESHVAAFFVLSILSVLLVVGGVSANRLLTHAVIRPTAKLSDAIRKVREGALGEQVAIDSGDEIGSMAADFNDMSQRLRKQHEDLMEAIQAKDSYADQLAVINGELETLNAELEVRVADRTRELQRMYEQLEQEMVERQMANEEKRQLQEKLARSQKMEALGLLAGGVAHDLNNVLSGIVSYPDLLLLKLEADHPLRPPIMTIRKSGQKASAIVQDLLTLARRGVVARDVTDINAIVTAYLNAPEHREIMRHHHGIAIQVDLADDLMPILGSPVHITKTIMNLVSNAAEAQPDGGTIAIRTENCYLDRPQQRYQQVDEGEYVLLRVSDTGKGIAPDDLERIFEPFYSKKVLGRSGTGLGMAVVWGTVQDHMGYIDVQSAPGQGATFDLYFPVTRRLPETFKAAASIETLMGKGDTVLIVDDVEEQREITKAILTHLNYEAVAVDSGEAAVAYLKDRAVDLVILDMVMEPGMDGLDTYRRIIETHPSQKAIIASGYAENTRVREVLRLGAGAYIRKPFSLEKLGALIHHELRG
jgi:signal transduction histidine kinase